MAVLADLLVRLGVKADGVDEGLGKAEGFFAKHKEKIAVAGAALGAGAAAGIATGIDVGLEKQQAGSKLAAQLGAAGPEADRLGKVAGNLYSSGLGEGLADVHDAVGAVVSSIDGMRTASAGAVQAVTGKVLNLAKAFDLDVNRAAQVAGQAVKSGLVKDVDSGLDLITASMQKLPAGVREDLLDAVDEYGPFMKQIGVTGQKAFDLLVQSSEKGAFGLDKTGDALKEFTIRATDMSTSTATAYKAIGLNQKQMTADLLAGGDRGAAAFQKIVTGLQRIKDPTKQSQAALALFGTPLEDLSTGEIPKFLSTLDTTKNTLGNVAGAANNLGNVLNDNAANGVTSWKRKTEGALAAMVDAPGTFGDTAQAATGVAQAVAPIGGDLGGLALAAVAGGKALGPLAKGAWAVTSGMGKATWAVVTGGAKMGASMAVTAGRVVAGWVLMGAQSLLAAAKVAAAWLISLGPIGLVIAAVVGIVVLVVKYWDQIKGAVAAGWNWIKGVTSKVWDFIVDFLKEHWDLIVLVILGPIGFIVAQIIKHWDEVKQWTSNAWNAVVGFVSKSAINARNAVVGWISSTVNFVRGLPGRLLSAIGNLGSLLYNAGRNVIQGLINGIWSMLRKVGDVMGSITQKIRNFLPFSPAKEGPLSGSGNPAVSGAKIAAMLADGMESGRSDVAAAAAGLAGAAQIADPLSAATAGPTGVRQAARSGGALVIRSDGTRTSDFLVDLLRAAVRDRGGDVQTVLGG
jgi:hypothetical protein